MAKGPTKKELADRLAAAEAEIDRFRAELAEAASVVRPPTPRTDPETRPPKRGPAPAWAASARRHR